MDISAALVDQLAALTQSLDDGIDLETQLRVLGEHIKLAVTSYLGMTMTVFADGHEVSFTVREEGVRARKIRTSLQIPLDGSCSLPAHSHLVIYAATPGAFVDLAADLTYALALDPTKLALDVHLLAPSADPGMTGLATHSVINQAVGVLIALGHTPESARDKLRQLADSDGGDLASAAAQLLRDGSPRQPTAEAEP